MIKRDEISDPTSCLNRALEDEPLFVLRAKDIGCVSAVLAWIKIRIEMGKNKPSDPQILEARQWCDKAVEWRQGKTGTTS